MAEYKATKRSVMDNYNKVIEVGYCGLQNLLRRESRSAYTTGTYGWNADVYDFGDVAIVTGYRPFGNVRPDYEVCNKYDTEAMNVIMGNGYDTTKEKLDNLIKKFIEEVTS